MNHVPGTDLPWRSAACPCGQRGCSAGVVAPFVVYGQGTADRKDTDYIAHAANAYPKLVAFLNQQAAWGEGARVTGSFDDPHAARAARALLEEIDEVPT